jgi:beta propeller repeat protein
VGIPPRCRWILAIALTAAAPAAAQTTDPASEVIVRFWAAGPHAITECAAAQYRRGRPLAAIARDRSDSLDRLNAELHVRELHPVFRAEATGPLAGSRASLEARARVRLAALAPKTRAALPAVPDLADVYRLALPPHADASAAAARYAADPHVVWAHASAGIDADLAANDPFLGSSGSWGQPYADLWGIYRVRAPEAWDTSQGDGVVVAVVDTGIDTQHPDLAANVWVNPGEDLDGNGVADPSDRNGIDDDGNGVIDDLVGFDFANSVDANGDGDFDDAGDVSDADPFDDFGHGTHVAGTIAAVANNGIGVAGVAPRARLMAVKGLRATGSTPDFILAQSMVYAAQNGARVINNSWSCSPRCPSNPVLEEAQAYASSLGVVVVTSAGNRSDDVVYYSPKWRHDNIVVGASDDRDRPAPFTNVGFLVSTVAPGSGDFFAPGFFPQRAILSTRSSGAGIDADGGGVFTVGGAYLRWAGTSMSTPHVSGIAALVLALHPEYTPDDVRAVIRSSARDLGAAGPDRATGAGLADAARALQIPLPAVRADFDAPAPGAVIAPEADVVVIRGAVTGPVASAELAVGVGPDPGRFDPIPLAAPLPERDGELARWDVADREDGPYVLRLTALGSDGSRAIEFLPLSLERNVPARLSAAGVFAQAPVISGSRVVWEAEGGAAGEDAGDLGIDLFARDWMSGGPWRVVSAPGDQTTARLSGDRLSWLDSRDHLTAVKSCRLEEPNVPCRGQTAAEPFAPRAGLDASGERLVWWEGDVLSERLRGCTWRGGACADLAMPRPTDRQFDPILRGSRLWWREQGIGWVLFTCAGFPDRCAPAVLEATRSATNFAGTETRLVWSNALDDPGPVYLCRASGTACPPQLIGTFSGRDLEVAVDRHRVVWSAAGPGGDLDVYFCEDDPLAGACPVQRLTGSAADQRNPEISGTRVVWEDDRDGVTAIAGFELPSLDPVPDRRTAVGRPVRLAVRGRDPAGPTLALSAAFADGTPLSARGAVFTDRGDGTGSLVWTPGSGDVGEHVVTFAGRTAGHLTTRTSARIAVSRSPAAP